MSKLTRVISKVFGLTGNVSHFGKFGSQAAEDPVYTKDVALIQALSAWDTGWQDAINTANKAPFLEDLNGAMYAISYQQNYMLQEGVPEWQTDAIYYIGSIVKKTGTFELYGSLTDDNTGNALPSRIDAVNWKYIGDLGTPSEKLIVDYAVTVAPGTATPMITIGNLDSDLDVSYRLELYIENGKNGSSSVFLRFNGDTGANYGWTRMIEYYPADPAQGAGINSTAILLGANSNWYHMLWSQIRLTARVNQSGGLRVLANSETNANAWSAGGAGYAGDYCVQASIYQGSVSKLTEINIVSDFALGIGVGSRIRVWAIGKAGTPTITLS